MAQDIVPGLAGVPVTRSSISFIDGQKGILEYRGIRVEELVKHSNFLETAYLLIHGDFPIKSALSEWTEQIHEQRTLQPAVLNLIKSLPKQGHPMNAMVASVMAVGMCYSEDDKSQPNYPAQSTLRLIAKFPSIVAAFHRIRNGEEPLSPRDDLDYAGNFLWMLTGRRPKDIERRIMDAALVIHADHTMNASTFASRVTGSTLANAYMVIGAAIGTLDGPLHGGANEAVLKQLAAIGSVGKVRGWLEEKIASKEKIMGLGHRVYKVKDPRAVVLQGLAEQLFEELGHNDLYDVAIELEKVSAELLGEKGIYPNVDFYSGLVYDKLCIPADIFTPIFAIGRAPGWLAHWREQIQDNRIYRPAQVYTGQHNLQYVPMEERKEEIE
jgi:citrate synthase